MRKGKRILYLIIGLLILSLVIWAVSNALHKDAAITEEKYIPVEVVPAAIQTLVQTTAFSGKVYSEQEVSLVPKLPGKVVAVNVAVGDQVQAGAVLLTLDTQDLQKAVEQAVLAERTAEVNYRRTKEQLDLAKTNLERQQKLFEAGMISQAQLEGFKSQASETFLELAQVQWDQAKLGRQQAQQTLDNAVLRAPGSGMVAALNVKKGEMAGTVQPAVIITNLNTLYVALNVPENIVNLFRTGEEAQVTITSAGEAELIGKITNIAPASDTQTQLFIVKVAVENKEGNIRPGMFARVELPISTTADVLAVSSESVVLRNDKNIVFVVENDQAVAREVVTGLDSGSYTEITQGLTAGDKVITKGQTLVEEGSKVKIVGGNAS